MCCWDGSKGERERKRWSPFELRTLRARPVHPVGSVLLLVRPGGTPFTFSRSLLASCFHFIFICCRPPAAFFPLRVGGGQTSLPHADQQGLRFIQAGSLWVPSALLRQPPQHGHLVEGQTQGV